MDMKHPTDDEDGCFRIKISRIVSSNYQNFDHDYSTSSDEFLMDIIIAYSSEIIDDGSDWAGETMKAFNQRSFTINVVEENFDGPSNLDIDTSNY